ncbi:olfactory receptor class A-like protein 1 [Dendropsophus ebraccatus]|uniref:olfactory receptor class A-like protein 1 n=1 Tax=Dendropsophus ebraccatus TaxID=150705 RepID=UPI003831DEE1
MAIRHVKAFIFMLITVIGIPGNLYVILKFVLIRLMEKKLLPANQIFMVLALANLFIVFSRVIPQSLHAVGLQNLMDDASCKVFGYTYRVSRAMSICTTSLLSCHQCILIAPSPSTRIWKYLKQKVTQNIFIILVSILVMNLILYRTSFMYANARKNFTSPYTLHLVYCDTDFQTYVSYIANGIVFASRDFLFVAVMTLASFYIVYVLLRHARTVKGIIRSSDKIQTKSIEYKASRAVILLVMCYVVFLGLDNAMWIYTLTLSDVTTDMNDARIVLACAYSALSPIVTIVTNPKLQRRSHFCDAKSYSASILN